MDEMPLLRDYAERWGIERLFLSWKSHGWELERCGVSEPERLGRLVSGLVSGLVVATVWRLAIAVARMAALAKATSLAAACVGGFAAGFLLYVAPSLDKTAYRADAYASAGTFVSAVVLILAALYLENGCRVPTQKDGPGQLPDAPGPSR